MAMSYLNRPNLKNSMNKLLLLVSMWTVSALFFYLSMNNVQKEYEGYDLKAFTVAFDEFPTLTWSIQNINSLNKLEVLRSEDGRDWEVIESIDSRLKSKSSFTYQDKSAYNNVPHLYYQLRFSDKDENVQLSEVILTQPTTSTDNQIVAAVVAP